MPKDLCCYTSSGVNLYTHINHLKHTPVTVLYTVLEEFRGSVIVLLISWVRDPSTVGDYVLSIIRDVD
jgi:hypothetical protein